MAELFNNAENTNDRKTVTLRVPVDVYGILENLAWSDCRHLSREIFFLIKQEAERRAAVPEMRKQRQPCNARIIQFPVRAAL
jgi:hypothetical protein